MSEATRTPSRARTGWTYLAIVLGGVITLASVVLVLPVGVALIVANVVLAVVTRGVYRKLFIGIAIAGTVLSLCVVLTLFTARF